MELRYYEWKGKEYFALILPQERKYYEVLISDLKSIENSLNQPVLHGK